MARAEESIFVRLRNNSTREMGKFFAISYECVFSGTQKQASIMSLRIDKGLSSTDGELFGSCDLLNRRLTASPAPEIFQDNPKLARSKCQANQDHEFREVSPREVMGLGPVNRKVLTPLRLFVQ
jgi:hypothetical protein